MGWGLRRRACLRRPAPECSSSIAMRNSPAILPPIWVVKPSLGTSASLGSAGRRRCTRCGRRAPRLPRQRRRHHPARGGAGRFRCRLAANLNVNVSGVFYMCRAAIRQMKTQPADANGGHGAIVNFGSIWGELSGKGALAYAASKGAVHQITRTFAIEHARDGIRVNAVCPVEVDTPMLRAAGRAVPLTDEQAREMGERVVPMGRLGQPWRSPGSCGSCAATRPATSPARCITWTPGIRRFDRNTSRGPVGDGPGEGQGTFPTGVKGCTAAPRRSTPPRTFPPSRRRRSSSAGPGRRGRPPAGTEGRIHQRLVPPGVEPDPG